MGQMCDDNAPLTGLIRVRVIYLMKKGAGFLPLLLSVCQRYVRLFSQETKHKLGCLSSFALHNTCKVSVQMRSAAYETNESVNP